MSLESLKGPFFLSLALSLLAPVFGEAFAAESSPAERVFGSDDAANAPIALRISSAKGSRETGIGLRVELENADESPQTLSVCDSMTLCCVKGLHPLIAYDDTQMGLQDRCKSPKPTSHQVFLPVKATFAFDAAIPPKWLPESVLSGKSTVTIQLCYEFEEGKTVHSNAIEVSLR